MILSRLQTLRQIAFMDLGLRGESKCIYRKASRNQIGLDHESYSANVYAVILWIPKEGRLSDSLDLLSYTGLRPGYSQQVTQQKVFPTLRMQVAVVLFSPLATFQILAAVKFELAQLSQWSESVFKSYRKAEGCCSIGGRVRN